MTAADVPAMVAAELRRLEGEGFKDFIGGPLTAWRFKWSRSYRAFGLCMYRPRVIKISAPLAASNTPERVRETILHEIAHAIAGHRAGHGWPWRNVARKIGLENPTRCWNEDEKTSRAVNPNGFTLECPRCHQSWQRTRPHRTWGWKGFRCGVGCRSSLVVKRNLDGAVVFDPSTVIVAPPPVKPVFKPIITVWDGRSLVAAHTKKTAPRKHATDDDVLKVVALHRAGMSYRKIEAEMGWPKGNGSRAFAIVKKHGGQ